MAADKCTFGTRPEVDLAMLNEKIAREVKHFRNYKIYRPNFGSLPVATKFYAAHDQLKTETEAHTNKVTDYAERVAQSRAKGPHSKYPSAATENQEVPMGLPRFYSASGMFAQARVDCFYTTMRKRATSLVRRVRNSPNSILKMIADRYGWYFTPLLPMDRNDQRFYHPKRESTHTKIEIIISMCNPKKCKAA